MWVWEAKQAKGVFILIHGAGEYHARYTWLIDQLVAKHFHVIMGDLPGQGLNPKVRGHIDSFQDYIDTISNWYEEAKKFQLPIFLFGHSMGGLVAIQTMLQKKFEVKAIILSSPCLGLVNQPAKLKHYSSFVLNKVYPTLMFPTNLERGSGTRSEEMRNRDTADPNLVKKVSVRWYSELIQAIEDSHRRVNEFPERPLLILQGGNDLIVDKMKVQSWFNRVGLQEKYYKEWPNFYHEVLNEPEKDRVFSVLLAFVLIQLEEN